MPVAVQLCRFGPELEAALSRRFELVQSSADSVLQMSAHQREAAEFVLTSGSHGCSKAVRAELPNVRMIAIHGVGFDKVDLDVARQRGILVSNTPDVLTDDVADLAVGLIIAALRGIPASDRFVRSGLWCRADFPLGSKVTGKRFGILGLGRIGRAIAERLQAFGAIAYSGTRPKPVRWTYFPDARSLAEAVDVLIVACSANDATRGMVNADVLAALGSRGTLVNVARGSVVDEAALVEALAQGIIGGAALDVFADEPKVPAPLLARPDVVMTPHIGSATQETRADMAAMMLDNIDTFLAGGAPVSVPLPE